MKSEMIEEEIKKLKEELDKQNQKKFIIV